MAMVYSRAAIALSLLLAACPGDDNPSTDTDASSGGQSTTPTSAGSEGPCPGGGSLCGTECVFLGSDENNCGGCGNVCAADEECIAAVCTDLDPCDGGPGTPCGSVCVADINTDPDHCGECNNDCDDGEVCSGGTCQGGAEGPSDSSGDPPGTTGEPPGTTGEPPGSTGDPGTTGGGSSTG